MNKAVLRVLDRIKNTRRTKYLKARKGDIRESVIDIAVGLTEQMICNPHIQEALVNKCPEGDTDLLFYALSAKARESDAWQKWVDSFGEKKNSPFVFVSVNDPSMFKGSSKEGSCEDRFLGALKIFESGKNWLKKLPIEQRRDICECFWENEKDRPLRADEVLSWIDLLGFAPKDIAADIISPIIGCGGAEQPITMYTEWLVEALPNEVLLDVDFFKKHICLEKYDEDSVNMAEVIDVLPNEILKDSKIKAHLEAWPHLKSGTRATFLNNRLRRKMAIRLGASENNRPIVYDKAHYQTLSADGHYSYSA